MQEIRKIAGRLVWVRVGGRTPCCSMLLSAVSLAKSKSKSLLLGRDVLRGFVSDVVIIPAVLARLSLTILVKLVSQAGTGFSFNHKRSRLREKLTLLHYDPIGKAQK